MNWHQREILAIALYESWARFAGPERPQPCWSILSEEDRTEWRDKATTLASESTNDHA